MKPTREESLAQIERAILSRREEVVEALEKSFVIIPASASDNELLDLVMTNLKNGNGFLIYNLAQVIAQDEVQDEEQSNFLWWGKKDTSSNMQLPKGYNQSGTSTAKTTSGGGGANWGAIGGVVGNVASGLGNWMNNKAQQDIAKTQAESIANQNYTALKLAQIQKEMQEKQLASQGGGYGQQKDNSGIIIASIIGGVLLVGTIITVVVLKKK